MATYMERVMQAAYQRQYNKQMQKREEMFDKYLNTKDPTEFQERVMTLYHLMKIMIPKYPELIRQLYKAEMKCFELAGSDSIQIGKEVLYKNKEKEHFEMMEADLRIIDKAIEKVSGVE